MFTAKRFESEKYPGEYLDYLFYQPDSKEPLPLLIKLPGAGSRGTDVQMLQDSSFVENIQKMGGVPARVIIPQCRFETWFDYFHVLCDFVKANIDDIGIDKNRIYIVGCSMGAYATWQLCISHPEWFAAAVPVCGGGMYWNAGRLKDIAVWAFHGAKDPVVLCCESEHMVERINLAGGNAKLTIFPEADHNAWEPTFSCEEMWHWLFLQKKA